ncbi:12082_t:CDS:1 [Funneliformis caledonium]|uniref:12082_t:CDS:1 n=1 Tax=Funneliformis caledonium TaxID=1117310 RepID=A0A9N9ER93_9GLOM|nr:12082_t:CDS:1 [Funneliformis caledonium]
MGCVTYLFFAHNESVALTHQYSSVLLMDCTYKTNKFKMPLLDIVGITSFNITFYSCFVFMKGEERIDYQWALTHIARLFDGISRPGVIVTDRELALMNALEIIFPDLANLLCLWHINKNILKNCKPQFSKKTEN